MQAKKHSLIPATLVFVLLFLILISLIMTQDWVMSVNTVVYQCLQSIRQPDRDYVALVMTLLGQKWIVLPTFLLLGSYFFLQGNWALAILWVVYLVLVVLSTEFVKYMVHFPRPNPLIHGYSFPSGHVTLAIASYGFLAYIIISEGKTQKRAWYLIFLLVAMVIICVAFTRLYLGAHWLTDVLGSMLLGSFWLAVAIACYRRLVINPLQVKSIVTLTVVFFILLAVTYEMKNYRKNVALYARSSQFTNSSVYKEYNLTTLKLVEFKTSNELIACENDKIP